MKFVSKFQLELPLAWQGCVAPGCDISVTPSDMSDACSLCTNVEVIHHYVI
jgi:hypothetical protein